jgi:lipopolysaccharide transport system permease protein
MIELAILDLRLGFAAYEIWISLAWEEIKQRYRRSILGPIWITISMGVLLAAMGPLYGRLFGVEMGPYIRSLSLGMILWSYISGTLNDSCAAFVGSEGFIKQIKLPLSLYLFKTLARNLIVFAHNSVILILVLIIFPPQDGSLVIMALLGLLLVSINLFWMGGILALICTRFRDVAQLIANILQLLFFLTPVMWTADLLKGKIYIAEWNLFFHFIESMRAPLIGSTPTAITWLVLILTALLGSILAFGVFANYRSRISYWI